MVSKPVKRLDLNDALEFVMSGYDSDVGEFSSDEDDDDDEIRMDEDRVNDNEPEIESDEEVDVDTGSNAGTADGREENARQRDQNKKVDKIEARCYRWRHRDIPKCRSEFHFVEEQNVQEKAPLDYFQQLWTDEITNLVVEQTNLYSTQQSGNCVNTSKDEMEQFIGMHIKMGIVQLPSYISYWSQEMRYPPVADVMPRGRFQKLKKYLHFVDNMTYNETVPDKLFKIRPVLEKVRNQCLLIPPEECHSVDEQVIPSKTRYSKIRQYNPKKPNKWGFKNLVRAGASGIIYDFYIYGGKVEQDPVTDGFENLQKSAQVVARLCKDLPHHANHKLFFDNWFSTISLFIYLKKLGILACGTMRANRLQGCRLKSNKELKKSGRGSMDYMTDLNTGVIITKWMDNNAVHIASNFIGVEPMSSVTRWIPEEKCRKEIQCPRIIKEYNGGMGGVDLADMLIALYRIAVKTHRWYIKVFWHCVDICKVNAWLLYRRDCNLLEIPKRKQQSLLQFSCQISEGLIKVNKASTNAGTPGRPRKRKSNDSATTDNRGRKPVQPEPTSCSRLDQVGHWPVPEKKRGRCRHCKTGYSQIFCSKCQVCLCLKSNSNCFIGYHSR